MRPVPRTKAAFARPLSPRPVKYSFLARNVTRRRVITGRNSESHMDGWLLASSAPPEAGMCCSPMTTGRKSSWKTGRRVYLTSQ
jgi:hypothetical protein